MIKKNVNSRCAILLATYNGKKYINQQIESIQLQKNIDITIFISDDISQDETLEIIISLNYENISVLPKTGRRGSASQNFFRLVMDVDFSNFDYIAFADQDDIWNEDKLLRAITAIEEKKLGGYSSNVVAFWENGDKKLINKSAAQKKYDFLFASPGPGCTQVFTRNFMQSFKDTLLENKTLSTKIELHDWVIYAYARANGFKWWIDPVPTMQYRQHGNNEFGANSGIKAFRSRWNKARNGWYSSQIYAIADFCNLSDSEPINYLQSKKYLDKVKLSLKVFQLRRKKSEALLLAFMLLVPRFR